MVEVAGFEPARDREPGHYSRMGLSLELRVPADMVLPSRKVSRNEPRTHLFRSHPRRDSFDLRLNRGVTQPS